MFEISIPSRKGNKKVSEVRAQADPLPLTPNRPALRARITDRQGILLFSMAAGIIGGHSAIGVYCLYRRKVQERGRFVGMAIRMR